MNLLKFKTIYKSIKEFEETEFPDFTILTGLNGSGKTHLLEAILKGNCSINETPISEIIYFDYKDFYIQNEQNFNSNQLSIEKMDVWKRFSTNVNNMNYKVYFNGCKNDIQDCYELIKNIATEKKKPFLKLTIGDFEDKYI